jgi:hypothetical protein
MHISVQLICLLNSKQVFILRLCRGEVHDISMGRWKARPFSLVGRILCCTLRLWIAINICRKIEDLFTGLQTWVSYFIFCGMEHLYSDYFVSRISLWTIDNENGIVISLSHVFIVYFMPMVASFVFTCMPMVGDFSLQMDLIHPKWSV